jgi:acyl-ACP thioesterase
VAENNNPLTQKNTFSVGWQDVNAKGKLSMRAITQYLQESAWKHSRQLGFGYDFIRQQQSIWVMGKLEVKMEVYPAWEDNIIIETWHRGYEGLVASRDFNIYNADNQLIGAATSDWYVIGAENRRPKRLQFLDQFLESSSPIKSIDEEGLVIDPRKELPHLLDHRVMFSELDFHGHVNTSRYFEWVINACDPEVLFNRQIEKFGIRFLSECNLKEIIQISGQIESDEACFKGIRQHDGKVVFAATMRFEK